ncbi:hypothetical protein FQR65_LT16183 [Abscondita terminalis]|nr:hypothetical protein FQR65_LT16183 [Abscondita terminalis]
MNEFFYDEYPQELIDVNDAPVECISSDISSDVKIVYNTENDSILSGWGECSGFVKTIRLTRRTPTKGEGKTDEVHAKHLQSREEDSDSKNEAGPRTALATLTQLCTPSTSRGNTPYEWDEIFFPLQTTECMTKKRVLEGSPILINGNTDLGTPKNIAYHEYTYNKESETSVKRKRLDPQYSEESWRKEIASTEKAANSFRKCLRKIDTQVTNLSELVRGNTNTKREIKDVTNKLKSLMKAVTSQEMQDLLQTLGTQQNCPNYDTVISALTEEIQERKEKEEEMIREIEKGKKEKEEIAAELGRIKEDEKKINLKNYQDYLNCVDRDWTEDPYQSTKMKLGSVNQSKTDQDMAVWCSRKDEDAKDETSLQFLDLTEIEEDVGYLTITTTFKKQGQTTTKNRHIIKLQEQIFYMLKKLAKIRQREDMQNQLVMNIPEKTTMVRFRKLAECALSETGMPVIIASSELGKANDVRIKKRKTYALVVEAKESNYNELLKTVKETLDCPQNAEAVKVS